MTISMRTPIVSIMAALLIVLVARPASAQGDAEDRERAISGIIGAVLDREHFAPHQLDSTLSEEAFLLYLERLDPSKQFLTASDVAMLTTSAPQMVEGVRDGDYAVLNRATTLLEERVLAVQDFYDDLLAKPFDFTTNESLIVEPDSLDYAGSMKELRERWRLGLKYQTLLRYIGMLETEKLDQSVFHPELEVKARAQVLKNTERWFERILALTREDHLSRYVNAIVNVFDPHTEYYPPLEKENFDISITGQLEGIGAQLREEDGYIKVMEIVPGSASWRGKELEAEDLILKVAQDREDPVDVVGVSIDDVVKLVRGPKGTGVTLTVKKPDGRIKAIRIVRDVVQLEETFAKGAIFERGSADERGDVRRYGYILLPKFYTDFNKTGAPRASDDIRRILEEFKEEGVEGVVLDLRNNGGGSLQEAIDIAGLFIETGPVVQVQDRNGNRQVLSDEEEDIVWDGDLVVMVNSFSASASEILSGMLQDYDRAVIVGTSPTFGKGTVQRFFDLDERLSREYRDLAPLGEVKVTTQQFYRVNGASTQFNGVAPDVQLPDAFSFRDIGERSLDYALPADTIDQASHIRWLDRDIPGDQLAASSQARVEGNEFFRLIGEQAEQMRREESQISRSLNWRDALAEQQRLQAEADRIEASMVTPEGVSIEPLESDIENEARKELAEEFVKDLKQDAYVDEAIMILNDMRALSIEFGWTFQDDDKAKGSQ
jgi:carboxyl-terminal processing protease